MDFEFYRNFITVAETGNLTTASKKLALAQPALSAQIKTLEHYYGAKLIQTARGKRQLTLTEAGEAFLGDFIKIRYFRRGSLPGQGPPDLPHRRNHPFRYAELQ